MIEAPGMIHSMLLIKKVSQEAFSQLIYNQINVWYLGIFRSPWKYKMMVWTTRVSKDRNSLLRIRLLLFNVSSVQFRSSLTFSQTVKTAQPHHLHPPVFIVSLSQSRLHFLWSTQFALQQTPNVGFMFLESFYFLLFTVWIKCLVYEYPVTLTTTCLIINQII